jgi:hypothetical protein
VPRLNRPAAGFHIETMNVLAVPARAGTAASPLSRPSRLKNAYTSMFCSVDFHWSLVPEFAYPPV